MEMHPWIISLLALSGSAMGALASVATTWVTQHFRDRRERLNQEASRRERLFGAFVEQASKTFADGMMQDGLDEPAHRAVNRLVKVDVRQAPLPEIH